MKTLRAVLFFSVLAACLPLWSQEREPVAADCNCQVVRHLGYTLAYDERHEQARWVAYVLTCAEVEGEVSRKGNDRFFADSAVATQSAQPWDYGGSGYDRGPLAPAADMKWSRRAMRESFLMSNVSPQRHDFNDGVWLRAEEQVRRWAVAYDSVYIVTGPVLKAGLPKIGKENSVSVPQMFYKVVYNPARRTGIALLIEHRESKKPLTAFATTIDEAERVTGIDFFPGLPNEAEIESTLCIKCWEW